MAELPSDRSPPWACCCSNLAFSSCWERRKRLCLGGAWGSLTHSSSSSFSCKVRVEVSVRVEVDGAGVDDWQLPEQS